MSAAGIGLGLPPFASWRTLVTSLRDPRGLLGTIIGPWRPPQWNQPQLYSLSVTEVTTEATSHTISGATGLVDSQSNPNIRESTKTTVYFFDAILRAEHRQELRRTEHPVQSGASLVDHAYLMPARISLEIAMSDCMARFIAGQFTSNDSKSISAFQTLLDLQARRIPLTLNTRLAKYENLLIDSVGAIESNQTRFGLRASVTFSQIIVANTATKTVSARPDATDTTNEGTKQPLPPPVPFDVQDALAGFPNG